VPGQGSRCRGSLDDYPAFRFIPMESLAMDLQENWRAVGANQEGRFTDLAPSARPSSLISVQVRERPCAPDGRGTPPSHLISFLNSNGTVPRR
jgi:hypothetical protein